VDLRQDRTRQGLGEWNVPFPVTALAPSLAPSPVAMLLGAVVIVGLFTFFAGRTVIRGRETAPVRRTEPRQRSRSSHVSRSVAGVAGDVASALRNQGYPAKQARTVAQRAARDGGDFETVFRRAVRIVS
jgi:hypothetical protein